MTDGVNDPAALRFYLTAAKAIGPLAPVVLRHRLSKGKELPKRWREKLGKPTLPRPDGRVIWLHAVGLGEVLALRGLIMRLADDDPQAHFLITSTTAKSAQAMAQNMPPRTCHQFLPLDAPAFCAAFLDHWQPDLCVWTEQDLWPAMVTAIAERTIPQAIVAGRMSDASLRKRKRARRLYAALFARMALIDLQDETSKARYTALGAHVHHTRGSLKPCAPPLRCDPDELADIRGALGNRFVWIAASSHPADEAVALAAHQEVLERRPDALLIIAPRFSARFHDTTRRLPVDTPRWSQEQIPGPDDAYWLADTTGDLGLFYRVTHAALIGGTHDATEGHNPWEAIALQTPVLHGAHTANFASDYAQLDRENGAVHVVSATALAAYLCADLAPYQANATDLLHGHHQALGAISTDLLALTRRDHD